MAEAVDVLNGEHEVESGLIYEAAGEPQMAVREGRATIVFGASMPNGDPPSLMLWGDTDEM